MKWFMLFLGFVFFADFFMYVQGQALYLSGSVYPMITLYLLMISETIFYGYVFFKLTNSRILKSIIRVMWLVCIPAYLLSFFLGNNETSKDLMVPATATNIFLAVIAVYYLYLFVLSNDTVSLLREPSWWLATGVALFFSCVSIGFLLYDFILRNNLKMFGTYLYNVTPRFMSLILYSCISICIALYAIRERQKSAFL
jgi:hypothetical protein